MYSSYNLHLQIAIRDHGDQRHLQSGRIAILQVTSATLVITAPGLIAIRIRRPRVTGHPIPTCACSRLDEQMSVKEYVRLNTRLYPIIIPGSGSSGSWITDHCGLDTLVTVGHCGLDTLVGHCVCRIIG